MRLLTILSGLALATSAAAQTSTGQACPSNSVSRFEKCTCPHGTDYQYSTTYAILGVNAADFSDYTSSCLYQPFNNPLPSSGSHWFASLRSRLARYHQFDTQWTRQDSRCNPYLSRTNLRGYFDFYRKGSFFHHPSSMPT
jgi:hypothetical protein